MENKSYYYNPSMKEWSYSPYMVKEYSVFADGFIATVVVVPMPKKKKGKKGPDDDESLSFVPMGVRIEDMSDRASKKSPQTGHTYHVPGRAYFFKFKSALLSEGAKVRILTDVCGTPLMERGKPMVKASGDAVSGEPLETHRMRKRLGLLIEAAKARYAEYREEKRAAA